MPKLDIAPNLKLPLDAVTQKVAFLGRTGSGKTYAAMKLAEEILAAHAQVVTLDPVGVWWGLRLAADGKAPGIAISIFGGLHGDLPLESTAGALIADVIVDRSISAIVDVSQFISSEQARFATDFATRLFDRKKSSPSAVMVFLEECQEFVPQNPMKGEERMLHAFQRMGKIGRNFGIGLGLISQRPQEVNKKVLNQTECVFAFQMTGPHERKAIREWVAEKGEDVDIVDVLPKLPVGQAHVWSPQWLQIFESVKISPKWTFNASSTPTVGGKAAEVKPLAPIDIEQLQKDMAAQIERAKAEDPRELRKRIAELERQVKAKAPETKIDPSALIKKYEQGFGDGTRAERKRYDRLLPKLLDSAKRVGVAQAAFEEALQSWPKADESPAPSLDKTPPLVAPALRPLPVKPERAPSSNSDGKLSKAGRKILTALAQFGQCPDTKVAALTGLVAGAGHFGNVLAELRGNRYIDGPRSALTITNDGEVALGPYDELPTGPELQEYWLARLPKGSSEILRALVDAYPKALSDEEIGARIGKAAKAGHFGNCLSELRTRDLISGQRSGLKASEDLF